MTVTYTAEVATSRLGCFLKLLRRWRGSIYKLVWFDLTIFLILYYTLSILYRFVFDAESKEIFESVVQYCKDYMDLIPISFVLGFYVSIVMTRWWNQYTTIPFPDPLAIFVSTTIHGLDEGGRMMRRTIMRYVCLCITMMFTNISPRVKRRFPSLDHFVEAGLLQDSEKEIISELNSKFPKYSKHWMPIVWAASIITRARKEGRIRDDFAVKTMIDELNKLRGKCGLLLSYDTISVPLVYTQVVTLAVYTYFMTTLMGHQSVANNERSYKFDIYFPIFTLLQFFFYMGWLKVAESLINPFGDDDDDFEINWMIDRNLQVSYLIVDEMHHSHPELVRDQYWDKVLPEELPYTLAAEPFRDSHPLPSTANIAVSPDDFPPPSSVKVDDMQSYGDMNSAIMFTAKPSLKRGTSQSSNIGTTVPDSISRVGSVTNMLKKLLSRENSRTDRELVKESPIELIPSSSAPTTPKILSGSPTAATQPLLKLGSTKLTDQVIEEVDEQTTITSMKGINDKKPTVFDLFPPPARSLPISVPQQLNRYGESLSNNALSKSAPEEDEPKDVGDNISIGSDTEDEGDDDAFSKLKKKRLQQRRSRLMLSLARSLSSNVDAHEQQHLVDRSPTSPHTAGGYSRRESIHDHADILLYEKLPSQPDAYR